MSGPEGDGGLLAALRADCTGFYASVVLSIAVRSWCGEHGHAPGFTDLAALGFVLELLVIKKHLFPGSEHKIGTAVDALQHLVLKFH